MNEGEINVSPEQENLTKILDKLSVSFDDFKERLIRIEENVKDVKSIKGDVEDLKIKYAALESKSSSAHKRIDDLGNDRILKIENTLTWLSRTVTGGFILGAIGLIFFTIQIFIKGN